MRNGALCGNTSQAHNETSGYSIILAAASGEDAVRKPCFYNLAAGCQINEQHKVARVHDIRQQHQICHGRDIRNDIVVKQLLILNFPSLIQAAVPRKRCLKSLKDPRLFRHLLH